MNRSYVILPAALLAAPLWAHGAGTEGVPQGATVTVARAQFTTAVHGEEPADRVTAVALECRNLYYFTELVGLEGQTVTHRWEHNDEVRFEQRFEVPAARFRTYSGRALEPQHAGEWKASVLDAEGRTLAVNTFSYGRMTKR